MAETEHSEYLKKIDHDYSVRGETEQIGRIATANHQHGNSAKSHLQKRRKHERELRHILEAQDALERFEHILEQLEIYLDELEEMQRQSIEAQSLIHTRDIEGSKKFLIEYHNLDPDDLAVMSDNEIVAVMMNIEGQNQDNIARLKSEIKDLAHEAYLIMGEHFDANNPDHQAMMNRLEAMENRAENLNTDFDTIVENIHVETHGKYSILEMKMEQSAKRNLFSKSESISDKFNLQALGDSDLNQQHEQELQMSNSTVQKPIGMNL
ncbi:hypothetical protein [Kordia sp.]|uniref:hypothetical protein n=1 Tax=Kordia sp. TaxID=1965332 RepID=UPI003D6B3066